MGLCPTKCVEGVFTEMRLDVCERGIPHVVGDRREPGTDARTTFNRFRTRNYRYYFIFKGQSGSALASATAVEGCEL